MAGLDVKVSQLGEVLVASDNDLLNLVTYDDQNQTYVSGKVKASTLKDYMIGDTDISGLGDGTPTGAIDALDGKIDDNYDEWKEQWQKNGAYNLLPNEATTQVVGEVTFTVASDGTVTAVINATTTAARELTIVTRTSYLLPSATYRMVGAPNDSDCYMYCRTTSSTYNYDSGNGSTFTDGVVWVRIAIKSGTSTKTLTFKPMITTDLNATYADYVPYAKTNRELTENVATEYGESGIITKVTSGNSIRTNGTKAMKFGNVVVVTVAVDFSADVNTEVTIGTTRDLPINSATSGFTIVAGGVARTGTFTASGEIKLYNPRSGWNYATIVYICK